MESNITRCDRQQNLLIIAHEDCMDGIGAAYCINQSHPGWHKETLFIQYNKEQKIFDFIKDSAYKFDKVIFGGFSLKFDRMIELSFLIPIIEVYDHHKTALTELEPLLNNDQFKIVFDMNRSGSLICYDEFKDFISTDKKVFEFISDRDLWKWNLPNSKEVSEGLQFYVKPNSLESFEEVIKLNQETLEITGSILLAKQQQQVASKVKKIQTIKLDEYVFSCLNVIENISEVGNELCKLHEKPSLMFFITEKQELVCSLRSMDNLSDISILAKRFGGGGHRNAAGFTIPLKKLPDLLNGKLNSSLLFKIKRWIGVL